MFLCFRNYSRSKVSAYVENNKNLFRGKKFNVEVENRNPKFKQYYIDDMKYNIYIKEKDVLGKFTALLDVCISSRSPFKH